MSAILNHPMVQTIVFTKQRLFRFETKFKYPDGGSVDLYLDKNRLTDFGETVTWLFHVQTELPAFDIQGVERVGGELVTDAENLAEAISRLGQACQDLSELAMASK